MIRRLIKELAASSPCQFELYQQEHEHCDFYRASGEVYQRFLVVIETDQLLPPTKLNQLIQLATPQELLQTPSYAKNTDLIVLFRLENLSDVIQFEHEIFDIEEDSYSFKKHVLYFSSSELEKIGEQNVNELIKDQIAFNNYKEDPMTESEYGLVCRLFIKLPFLSVPVQEAEMEDPCELADQLLEQDGLLALTNSLEKMVNNNPDYQAIIEEYVREKMANPTTED